ncbi:MAG: hypothetical protein AB7S56_05275 [Halothiobacillaceae bacterium]
MLTIIQRFMFRLLTMLTPVLFLAACGGGGGGSDTLVGQPNTPGTPITTASFQISLSADATSLNSGQETILTATVKDTSNKPVAAQNVTFTFGSNLSGATLNPTNGITNAAGEV